MMFSIETLFFRIVKKVSLEKCPLIDKFIGFGSWRGAPLMMPYVILYDA
jgi:hypothetical protein